MKGMTAALVLGSMLPDADAALAPLRFDLYLRAHASGTHSLVGAMVETCVLAVVLHTLVRGSRLLTLLIASWVGVIGHIFWDLADGSDMNVLRPFSDAPFGWHLVAMGDPIVLGILAVAALFAWRWRRCAPPIAIAALVMLGLLVAVKTASQQWARARYDEAVMTEARGAVEVAPEIGRLFDWTIYDRVGNRVRAWRVDARNGSVVLAFERHDALDFLVVWMSCFLLAFCAFLDSSKIPFVRVEYEGAQRLVLWSDIRNCSAIDCDLSFGGVFDAAMAPLYQVIQIGGFRQRRPLPPDLVHLGGRP
jgi:membrane-bound metal-dependent hydrolase YbcI (DUF457 family)